VADDSYRDGRGGRACITRREAGFLLSRSA
jgi:hypothetical protein